MNTKKMHGQFFTVKNPFKLTPFVNWFNSLSIDKMSFIEPFAGSKNIINMFESTIKWDCFDIDPKTKDVIKNDSIKNFPKGYDIAITNPPYLAKNSAKRAKLPYPKTDYDDLYKLALDVMINNCQYVVAIIPESFITSNLFHDKLLFVISINFELFDDTECPVCLAIFDKNKKGLDFDIYLGNQLLGKYSQLSKYNLKSLNIIKKSNFYNPSGLLGLIAIDNTEKESISFVVGTKIDSSKIKKTSRSITRISFDEETEEKINNYGLINFINLLNQELAIYRKKTKDVFLTAFKGLRKDNKYRRRISFDLAKFLIEKCINQINV